MGVWTGHWLAKWYAVCRKMRRARVLQLPRTHILTQRLVVCSMPPDEGEPPAQEQPAPAPAPPPAQVVAMATPIQQPMEAAVMQAVDPSASMPGMATARRGPKNSSSMYKGVTKHRRTGRYARLLWSLADLRAGHLQQQSTTLTGGRRIFGAALMMTHLDGRSTWGAS